MGRKSIFISIGVVLVVAGGVMLALGSDAVDPSVGTVFGIAGVGLLAWGWLIRSDSAR